MRYFTITFSAFSLTLTVLSSAPAVAISDSDLSRASRAEDARDRKHWDDQWLGIVAGAHQERLNVTLRNMRFGVQAVEVRLTGFRKKDTAFPSPGKRYHAFLSNGGRCLQEALKCGKEYQWKLYCANADGSRLYSEGGCGY